MIYEQVLQGVWHTNKKCAVFKVKVHNKIKTHLILYTGRRKQKGLVKLR